MNPPGHIDPYVVDCAKCGGSGWIAAYKDQDPLELYAFICPCDAARHLGIRPGKGAVVWTNAFFVDSWIIKPVKANVEVL